MGCTFNKELSMTNKEIVRKRYSEIATSNCGCGCCENTNNQNTQDIALKLGYSEDDLKAIPEDSNLGLGCGNPIAFAEIKPGETILDLGSGAGLDCFFAAKETGPGGKVIGVDMTLEMIIKANENLAKTTFNNIQFRHGEIEKLPVEDSFIDVVISNCVINLCEDKQKVYNEIFRVLKPGGRVAISDVAKVKEFTPEILNSNEMLCGCISGAASIETIKHILNNSGFINVQVIPKQESKEFIKDWTDQTNIEDYVISVFISAQKN